MRKYEFVFVLRPSVKDAEVKKLSEAFKAGLKDVKVVKEDDWGQKSLSYPIMKETAGRYFLWQLETETGIPTDFEVKVLRSNNVIRHLVLRTK